MSLSSAVPRLAQLAPALLMLLASFQLYMVLSTASWPFPTTDFEPNPTDVTAVAALSQAHSQTQMSMDLMSNPPTNRSFGHIAGVNTTFAMHESDRISNRFEPIRSHNSVLRSFLALDRIQESMSLSSPDGFPVLPCDLDTPIHRLFDPHIGVNDPPTAIRDLHRAIMIQAHTQAGEYPHEVLHCEMTCAYPRLSQDDTHVRLTNAYYPHGRAHTPRLPQPVHWSLAESVHLTSALWHAGPGNASCSRRPIQSPTLYGLQYGLALWLCVVSTALIAGAFKYTGILRLPSVSTMPMSSTYSRPKRSGHCRCQPCDGDDDFHEISETQRQMNSQNARNAAATARFHRRGGTLRWTPDGEIMIRDHAHHNAHDDPDENDHDDEVAESVLLCACPTGQCTYPADQPYSIYCDFCFWEPNMPQPQCTCDCDGCIHAVDGIPVVEGSNDPPDPPDPPSPTYPDDDDEPSDSGSRGSTKKSNLHAQESPFWGMFNHTPSTRAVLTCLLIAFVELTQAAGKDDPKRSTMENFLPGVTRWDGIPYHDFRRIWFVALTVALGSIAQDGWTLLQTARNLDQGSPGNPGTPAQTIQSQNRNQRLFACILNYIEPFSHVVRYVQANFANNGRGLFNYIYEYGNLPLSSTVRERLQNEWEDATMTRAGVKYRPNAVFKWAEYLLDLGGKLGKSNRELRVKYLDGFPDSFDVVVIPERQAPGAGNHTFPANYPAHHPNAGNAHPDAGQPDILAIALAFHSEWSRMLSKGKIKAVPKGMANVAYNSDDSDTSVAAQQVDDDSSDDGDYHDDPRANLARAKVTATMVCLVCGGLGHASSVDGVGECLTRKLGIDVDRSALQAITYPGGIKRPILKPSFKARNRTTPRAAPGSSRSPHRTRDDAHAARPSPRKPYPKRRPKFVPKGKARQVDDDPPNEEQPVDQHSDSSEGVEYEFEELAVRFANIQA